MDKTIDINMAEMATASGNTIISTSGIGSCIVIAIYDEDTKVGGLAHAILPGRETTNSNVVEEARANINLESPAKFADEAVEKLVAEIVSLGGHRNNLKAKLVGGAKMFRLLSGDNFGIGYRNIEAAKKKLAELGIPVISEDTGGTVGRMAQFSLNNGLMNVTTKM